MFTKRASQDQCANISPIYIMCKWSNLASWKHGALMLIAVTNIQHSSVNDLWPDMLSGCYQMA